MLAEAAALADGPTAGRALADRSVQLATRLGLWDVAGAARMIRAWCLALAGDRRAAEDDLAGATPELPPDVADLAAFADVVRAVPTLLTGDLDATRDRLDPAMAVLGRNRAGAPIAAWGLWVLLRAVLDDRVTEAVAAIRSSHALMAGTNVAGLHYADAVQAGRRGDAGGAGALLAQADGLLAAQPWWGRLLRLLVHRAALEDGWGDPVTGLRADLAGFEQGATSGDAALARTCRALLRQAGVEVRRGRSATTVPPALRAVGVTAREADVLDLVVQGLTNAQVAERLVLSVRTVDHHVASLLARTGAANRTELARFVAPAPQTHASGRSKGT